MYETAAPEYPTVTLLRPFSLLSVIFFLSVFLYFRLRFDFVPSFAASIVRRDESASARRTDSLERADGEYRVSAGGSAATMSRTRGGNAGHSARPLTQRYSFAKLIVSDVKKRARLKREFALSPKLRASSKNYNISGVFRIRAYGAI